MSFDPNHHNPYSSPAPQKPLAAQPPPPGYSGQAPHRGSTVLGLGVTALTLTILGVLGSAVCCLFVPAPMIGLACGMPAWFMGRADLSAMDSGMMDQMGRGSTQAGMICGMIASAIAILVFVVALVMIVVFGVMAVVNAQ
jgi:hypothetical protein